MTSPTAGPPPCPDCGVALTGATTCAGCGLRLTGPEAVRLWEVDQSLAAVDAQRAALLAERSRLLAALRPDTARSRAAAGSVTATSGAATDPYAVTVPPTSAPAPNWPSPVTSPRPEWTPQRVQNTLLSLGALLLTIAGIVFAAVTYDRLGAGGRAAVLVTLTLLAGAAVPRLKARGLDATAEAVTVVTLALAALDAYGLRKLGLAEDSAGTVYAAGSAFVLAVLAGTYAVAVPVLTARISTVVLAHLPVPLLLVHGHASAGEAGLALALVVTADLLAWVLLDRFGAALRDVQLTVLAAAVVTTAFATLFATTGAFAFGGEGAGQLALALLAALAAAAGMVAGPGSVRVLLTALPAPLVSLAAFAMSADRLTDLQQPLVLAAVALVAMQVAGLLPRAWRPGPVSGALAVIAAGLATQLEPISQAVALPLSWLQDPWTLPTGTSARLALAPNTEWDGTVVTLIVLVCAAVVSAGAGLALHRLEVAAVPTGALLFVAAVVLPLGLATSYPLALLLLLGCAAGLLTAGVVVDRRDVSLAALGAGTAISMLAATWSLADQDATLLVLSVLTVLFAGVATRRHEAAGVSALAAGALLAAGGAARGLATDQVGGLLLVAPAVLVALTFVLDGVRRIAVESAAVVLAVTAIVLTVGDPGWLSWALAATGIIALADALHPDRRIVAAAGGLLLSASSWVRLADAGVEAPEPYVAPLGLVAVALGWLRVRSEPSTRSFPAYSPGLSLLLLPSLIASFDDATLTRPLLLGGAALVVLLVGAQQRLQAPLVIGGVVLAIDALQLLAPYAAALPRWLTLGAAGLLLVAVGATYEQRRRDVTRLRERFDALA
ncbi:MAG: hypothetical protein QOE05_3716 [Actinomycetota bacterium]|jgi:hypothetical protein|nr:hypothetical protein [Actinomycetota bacterium]